MDACGGHAMPYHFHTDLACEYDATDKSAHAKAVALALDGYVMYGKWESSDTAPELDACNGHTGPVPADTTYGITTGADVYHYHSTNTPPFLLGCYGPIDSMEACKTLYPACSDSNYKTSLYTASGNCFEYATWCPCYQHKGSTAQANPYTTSTSSCSTAASDSSATPVTSSTASFINSEVGLWVTVLGIWVPARASLFA